jgi:ComF family protein
MRTAWVNPLRNWFHAGLGFLYPELCQICRQSRATVAEGLVCENCRRQVKPVRAPFCHRCGLPFDGALTTEFDCANCRGLEWHLSSARAAAVSEGLVREVIHRYKYQRALWFEPFLAGLLLAAAVPVLRANPPSVIVPVPLHPVKEREREFNQAARLAAPLAAALHRPLNPKLLRRVAFTVTQTHLTRSQRAANMRGVFAVPPGARVAGQSVVLVDDVFTTGATTNACARVLRAAGATEVCVWTAARGI